QHQGQRRIDLAAPAVQAQRRLGDAGRLVLEHGPVEEDDHGDSRSTRAVLLSRASVLTLVEGKEEEILASRIPPGAEVLDCGCGEGAKARALAARGCRVDGVEL